MGRLKLLSAATGSILGCAIVSLSSGLRAKFFNMLNHPSLPIHPDTNFASPTFSVISSTAVDPRVIQLALKLAF